MGITLGDLEICRSLALEAKEIIDRIESIKCIAERCTPTYSFTPKGRDISDKVADGAIEMAEFFAQRRETAERYLAHVGWVEAAIDELEDSEERRVLRHWYIDGLLPGEIMLRMHMSRRSIYNRRESALKNLAIEESLHTFARESVV